jgi:four helix bundle protein
MELETHFVIAQKLNFLDMADVDRVLTQCGEVSRMLTGLTKKLRAKGPKTWHLTPDT